MKKASQEPANVGQGAVNVNARRDPSASRSLHLHFLPHLSCAFRRLDWMAAKPPRFSKQALTDTISRPRKAGSEKELFRLLTSGFQLPS